MWKKVGVVRNGKDLTSAIPEIQSIRDRLKNVEGSGGNIYNAKWNEAINMANMIVVAELIGAGALMRRRIRGAHYRQDFPEKDAKWLRNICCVPENGDVRFWTTDVKFPRLASPELNKDERTILT